MIEAIVVSVVIGLIVGLAAWYNDREQQRVEREATSAATGRECGGSSVGVSNPTQPVMGSGRGPCNSPAPASRRSIEALPDDRQPHPSPDGKWEIWP